jgi:hypothetical protein
VSAAVLHERPPLPLLLRWPGLVLAALLGLAWRLSEGNLAALLAPEARSAAADFARGFWPPAHSPEFLRFLVRPLAETVAIAFAGMTLALVLAAPLAWLATAPNVARAAGDARNRITRASDSGRTHCAKSASGMSARLAGVSRMVGSTALTVQSTPASSAARLSVSLWTAHFDAA